MQKLKEFLYEHRTQIILALVFYVILVIFIVAPIASGLARSKNIIEGIPLIAQDIAAFNGITKIFNAEVFPVFGKSVLIFTFIFIVMLGFGLYKSRGREYSKKEHGSSDWSKGGEQYKVLSRNNGIILAENNYLPINKTRKC